ncbi:hypothetical protein A3F34_00355 [Candidatus Roizmanbacteria bacterium RIFCSPHIGHO2_12_FULL_44_10]|uniref:Uncharacterized protein n=1 Tax=Candidatus Roizmanbacteria bacterium RIFCSPHIGHO2_12_FULL_44_10 TaxID=1802054 RepID=A0A1F7I6H8_9BACT|nr:MAG: hypothetical protein A3F34_00355 [Candidatus Roizmanbacteria bacterium RIFCSPHIGHO2_12_FULL_44_10]
MRVISALDIIKQIMIEVELPQPSFESMLVDIQMMHFKIRPLIGDITTLSEMDTEVITLLWRIGRIDEIIHASYDSLSDDDQDKLLDYLQHVELQAESDLRRALKQKNSHSKSTLKLEVFRELLNDSAVRN